MKIYLNKSYMDFFSPELKEKFCYIVSGYKDAYTKNYFWDYIYIKTSINPPFNFINCEEDGISFLPEQLSNEYLMGDIYTNTFSQKGRIKMTPGRFIKRFFDLCNEIRKEKSLEQVFLSPKEIEDYANYYKAANEKNKIKIEEVSGEDIREWYYYMNYCESRDGSTLHNSCMRHSECQEYFDIYCENSNVKMIIGLNTDNKLVARAILWKSDENYYMDRVYYSNEKFLHLFKQYAISKNYHYSFDGIVKIKLEKTKFRYYPYLDNLPNLWTEEIIISNMTTKNEYLFLQQTDGGKQIFNRKSDILKILERKNYKDLDNYLSINITYNDNEFRISDVNILEFLNNKIRNVFEKMESYNLPRELYDYSYTNLKEEFFNFKNEKIIKEIKELIKKKYNLDNDLDIIDYVFKTKDDFYNYDGLLEIANLAYGNLIKENIINNITNQINQKLNITKEGIHIFSFDDCIDYLKISDIIQNDVYYIYISYCKSLSITTNYQSNSKIDNEKFGEIFLNILKYKFKL